MPFPAHYQRVNERRRVDEMITALLAWDASTGRSVAATELTFNVPVPGGSRPVNVSGSIDRVDRSEDGRIHVVDFKTGRTAASASATAEHPQLGIYQLAIRLGALDAAAGTPSAPSAPPAAGTPLAAGQPPATDTPPTAEHPTGSGSARLHRYRTWPSHPWPTQPPPRSPSRATPQSPSGQAELVHLADRFASGMPKVRFQAPLDDGWTWVNDLIVDAARLADGPDYPARPNGQCKSCAFRFMCPAQTAAPMGQPAALGTADASVERSEALAQPSRPRTIPDIPVQDDPADSSRQAPSPGPAVAVGG